MNKPKFLRKMKLTSIWKKLLALMLVIIFALGGYCAYVFIYSRNIIVNYEDILDSLYIYNGIYAEFNAVNDSLEFMRQNTFDFSKGTELMEEMSALIGDVEKMEANPNGNIEAYKVAYLRGTLQTYTEHLSKALSASWQNESMSYELSKCRQVAEFANERIINIQADLLLLSNSVYKETASNYKETQSYILLLFIAVITVCVLIIFYLSRRISKPIIKLARAAEKIASGDLDIPDVNVASNDEILLLGNSFNKMKKNIAQLISEITKKADIEAKLKEEEIKNSNIRTLLKEAELGTLQAQINPHFLFNTLNTIAGMAYLENAQATEGLIEATAELLRYNLGKVKEKNITLEDEIGNVKEYVYIQKIRFSDKIEFVFDIDNSLLGLKVPYLVLQPLVENAIYHGIEPKEGKGRLVIRVTKEDGRAVIMISDDGIGIEEEKLKDLFSEDTENDAGKRIGILNVYKRLELYYGRGDLMQIISKPDEGTTILLRLPYSV